MNFRRVNLSGLAILAALMLLWEICSRSSANLQSYFPPPSAVFGALAQLSLARELFGEYLVSQSLGSDATSCRADPQGFAQASAVFRDALERAPDLVVCNRFGALEAEGGGFAAELLALLERGIPVLTVVAPRHADAWQRFVGDATALTSDPGTWAAWLDGVMTQRRTSGADAQASQLPG